jgi:hypothetical protein
VAVLLRLAYLTVANTFAALRMLLMTNREKDTEILVLRHQVAVLERQLAGTRVRFTAPDPALEVPPKCGHRLLCGLSHHNGLLFVADRAGVAEGRVPTRSCTG